MALENNLGFVVTFKSSEDKKYPASEIELAALFSGRPGGTIDTQGWKSDRYRSVLVTASGMTVYH